MSHELSPHVEFICKCRSGSVAMQAFAHNYYCFMNRVNHSSDHKVEGDFFSEFDAVIRIQEQLCLFCKECDWNLWTKMITKTITLIF